MKIKNVSIGGWFPRTGLHLFEIYDFLCTKSSPLDLNPKKLTKLHKNLDLDSFALKVDAIEFIDIRTKGGIKIKIFEDGLIVLNKPATDVKKDIQSLRNYNQKKLSPVLQYLFSLGAPIPKELVNLKTVYPYFVVLQKAKAKDVEKLLAEFKQIKTFEIHKKSFEIYRGDKLYVINNISETDLAIERLIEERVFIREFKSQTHRYLNLHRIIWERIDKVKEQKRVYSSEISSFLDHLEDYKKTINLAETRINQMGYYLHTRASILKNKDYFREIGDAFEFKYDTMENTLKYVREIWKMTQNYVDAAIEVFTELQSRSTSHSVESLAVITAMGVGGTIMGLFTEDLPSFSWNGVIYFLILVGIGYSAKKILQFFYKRKKYEIGDIEASTDIQ